MLGNGHGYYDKNQEDFIFNVVTKQKLYYFQSIKRNVLVLHSGMDLLHE